MKNRASVIKPLKALLLGLVLLSFSSMTFATELTMFYPVAVGGPLTKLVDKLVQAVVNARRGNPKHVGQFLNCWRKAILIDTAAYLSECLSLTLSQFNCLGPTH